MAWFNPREARQIPYPMLLLLPNGGSKDLKTLELRVSVFVVNLCVKLE